VPAEGGVQRLAQLARSVRGAAQRLMQAAIEATLHALEPGAELAGALPRLQGQEVELQGRGLARLSELVQQVLQVARRRARRIARRSLGRRSGRCLRGLRG